MDIDVEVQEPRLGATLLDATDPALDVGGTKKRIGLDVAELRRQALSGQARIFGQLLDVVSSLVECAFEAVVALPNTGGQRLVHGDVADLAAHGIDAAD